MVPRMLMTTTGSTSTRLQRTAAVLAAGIALVALPGCGPFGSDEDDVKDVVKDYAEGIADGDGGKVCDTLTEESKKSFEDVGAKCDETFSSFGGFFNEEQKDKLKDVDPEVEINGDNATAKLNALEGTGSDELKLKKEDGDWKIDFQQR
jgi:hypothetical protein